MLALIDFSVVAQMITALVAVAALIFGPRLSFNASRRLIIAENRQRWLDAIRADIAELIALHEEIVASRTKAQLTKQPEPEMAGEMRRIGQLSAQIRMRLNIKKDNQLALNEAISDFITSYDCEGGACDPNKIIKAMDPIAREVWQDIKRARI